VGSISSVISVKSTSTFSLSGGDASHRHESKFNQIGRNNKKKKKKKKKGRTKIRSNCIDEEYCRLSADTATFLGRAGQLDLSRAL
jgi:chromatin remodeling complex protein RSC6